MTGRLRSINGWICVFRKIVQNRGPNTFGHAQLNREIARLLSRSAALPDLEFAESAIKDFVDRIKISKTKLVRVGPQLDGGYAYHELTEPVRVLSGGAGKNIDFELYFARRDGIVDLYDPTVRQLPLSHPHIRHFHIGLEGQPTGNFSKSSNLSKALETLDEIRLDESLMLKLDIEGSEWKLLEAELRILKQFDEVIIEFHDLYKLSCRDFADTFVNVWRYFEKYFWMVNFSSNNWTGFTNFGRAYIPETFEVTLVNKRIELNNIGLGEDLNQRNNPSKLDIPSFAFYFDENGVIQTNLLENNASQINNEN